MSDAMWGNFRALERAFLASSHSPAPIIGSGKTRRRADTRRRQKAGTSVDINGNLLRPRTLPMAPDASSNAAADAAAADVALTERKKMVQGLPYDAMSDLGLVKERLRARKYLHAYNNYPPAPEESIDPATFKACDYFGPNERFDLLAELFAMDREDVKRKLCIEPPFYCDYGTNIEFKGEFYCNFNTTILDCAKVTFGSRIMLAPNVNIYAGTHAVEVEERRAGLERAYPVTIGDDVWIGGNVSIIGPCTIGNGTTIAAGAVVKGDWPANVVLGGVPCRILKRLDAPTALVQ